MRGHLGTMLQQKAGTVLECRKLDAVITVSCSDARHEEMPAWSIMFDDSGRIVDADEQRRQQIEAHKAELLAASIFGLDYYVSIITKQLWEQKEKHEGCATATR